MITSINTLTTSADKRGDLITTTLSGAVDLGNFIGDGVLKPTTLFLASLTLDLLNAVYFCNPNSWHQHSPYLHIPSIRS